MIDKEYNDYLISLYSPEGSILRKSQLRMLDMLIFIDNICKENELTYWLDSGSLLGAARHGGFIPWDDDLDICMPRKDMEKLKKIMIKNNPSSKYVIQSYETDPCFIHSFVDVKDLKSEILTNKLFLEHQKYKGLQIDIFPVDNKISYHLQVFSARLRPFLIYKTMRIANKNIAQTLTMLINHILEKCIFPFFRLITIFVKKDYYMMSYGVEFRSKRFEKDIFPLTTINFEGYNFSAPGNTDNYLKQLYGDWEKVPKIENIKAHGFEIKFLE